MTYKATITVPFEQYGNMNVDVEGTPEEIVAIYREFVTARQEKPVNEMPELEFIKIYDKVGNGESVVDDPGVLQKMSPVQQKSLNDLKKFIKRCAYQAKK